MALATIILKMDLPEIKDDDVKTDDEAKDADNKDAYDLTEHSPVRWSEL